MSVSTTSQVFVERHLRGRDILFKFPEDRSDEELNFLKKWLPERIFLFRKIDSGKRAKVLFYFF